MAAEKKTAGLFDLRFIIGATDEELARGDGFNINLWAGLGMLVVGILFGVWAKWRPLVVTPDARSSSGRP